MMSGLRWLGRQVVWLARVAASVAALLVFLPLVPVLRAFSDLDEPDGDPW
jgi:hypothetical protein